MESLKEIYSQAPDSQDFGFDVSIYKRLKADQESLVARKTESEKIVSSVKNNLFIGILLFLCGLVGWGISCGLVFSFSLLLRDGPFEWLGIILAIGAIYGSLFLIGWIEERFNFSGWMYNLFTFGKYKKAVRDSEYINQKFETLTESAKNTVSNFEEAFYNYFQGAVERFYLNNLYKKRSGTEKFEEAIGDFDTMLKDLSSANDFLLTKKFRLSEYESYLIERNINHSLQQIKPVVAKEKIRINSFSEKAKNAVIKTKVLPPEQAYRVPRKIDWEAVNRVKALTGAKGEEIVLAVEEEYLYSVGRDDLAKKIQNIAKEMGDGAGYDILSFFEDGREKYIEVKTTVKSFATPYYLSRNELSFLNSHPNNAFIYRVLISENGYDLETQTAQDVLQESEITPINYLVKKK